MHMQPLRLSSPFPGILNIEPICRKDELVFNLIQIQRAYFEYEDY